MASPEEVAWSWPALDFLLGLGGAATTLLARAFLFGRDEGSSATAIKVRFEQLDKDIAALRADIVILQADFKSVATKADVARLELLMIEVRRLIDEMLLRKDHSRSAD